MNVSIYFTLKKKQNHKEPVSSCLSQTGLSPSELSTWKKWLDIEIILIRKANHVNAFKFRLMCNNCARKNHYQTHDMTIALLVILYIEGRQLKSQVNMENLRKNFGIQSK